MVEADDADNGGDGRVGAHAGRGVALVGVGRGYVMIWGDLGCCRLRGLVHGDCGGPKIRAVLHTADAK
jgi:hypothetical protein